MKRFDHDLDRALNQVAGEEGVDPDLLKAISIVETNGVRWAVRFERNYTYLVTPEVFAKKLGISVETEEVLQRISFGPMQLMGGVARERGFADHLTKLTDAQLAYTWSVKHLKVLLSRYKTEVEVIASWNWGSPKRTELGTFANQGYVDKVLRELNGIRARSVS